MPKRPRSYSNGGYQAKRRRYNGRVSKRSFARRNQFADQLGGWSRNSATNPRTYHLSYNTPLRAYAVPIGNLSREGKVAVTINAQDDFGQITESLKAFQRFRIKKATLFMIPQSVSAGNPSLAQVTLGKMRRSVDTPLEDAWAIAGAETKVFQIGNEDVQLDRSASCIRKACFYPTIEYDIENTSSRAVQSAWLPTRGISSDLTWNAFLCTVALDNEFAGSRSLNTQIYYNLELELRDPIFGQ